MAADRSSPDPVHQETRRLGVCAANLTRRVELDVGLQPERRQRLWRQSAVRVDPLSERGRGAFSPDEERARAVLALPTRELASAAVAGDRRVRLVFVEHAHVAIMSPPCLDRFSALRHGGTRW